MIIGLSGASGMPIGERVLTALREAGTEVALVVSAGAEAVWREECGSAPERLAALATVVYADTDLAAPIASGSRPSRGMAIVPASSGTVARVALGLTDSLLTRAAHVQLKEHRPLVLVPRETPLSPILLAHLTRLAELGVTILPPVPAYYLHPKSIGEMTNYFAGKVLDHLGVPHRLYRGWKAPDA